MTIQYRIVKRTNNISEIPTDQYIMQAVHTGIISHEQLVYEVSNQCTLHQADIEAVLVALVNQMEFHLKEGRVVEINRLGRYKIGFQGVAKSDPKLLSPKDIRKFYINYQPTPRTKKWLKNGLAIAKEPKK